MADDKQEKQEKKPKTTGRSPSFPYVNLETAIGHVRKINDAERGHPCSREVAFGHIGMSPKSGPGRRTLAAWKAFDLVKVEGDKLELTPLAHRIIDDERPVSPERTEAIQKAALSPSIHARLWGKYKDNLPSDASLRHELIWEEGFNKASVEDFIGEYKRTLDYAKVGESATLPGEVEDEANAIEVGAFVQWESQGVDQFSTPLRVRALQEKDGQEWVFVEGYSGGILASQVEVVEPPEEPLMPTASPTPAAPTVPAGGAPVLPLPAADSLSLSIPFRGKTLTAQVRSQGEPLRSEHIAKVIKHLELSKDDLDPES